MRYARLGRSALQVSQIILGTLNLGVRTTSEEGVAILDTALDCGINTIDTANDYGWQRHKGFTEEFLGDWFALGGGRRDKVVLATKVCNPMSDWPNDSGLSARNIIYSCEQSLRRLKTDWIDLYQMHRVDPHASLDEIWQAMDILVRQGKVRYVGSSNFAGWNVAAAQERARQCGGLGLVSEQCVYNLVARDAEAEVLPAAAAYGVSILAWSPLHGGLLSGALRKLADGTAAKTAQGRAKEALPRWREQVEAFENACASVGLDPAEAALSWVLSRPGITSAVIGPRTIDHLHGAVRALDRQPPDGLEKLFGEAD
jgi:NDP-hexose C3-ketoreductase / dTDP-4-oxo-2-deoxy-alpha-D-pentos-2-ene 2,3-reductase